MKVKAKFNGTLVKKGEVYSVINIFEKKIAHTAPPIIAMFIVYKNRLLEVQCTDIKDFNNRWEFIQREEQNEA